MRENPYEKYRAQSGSRVFKSRHRHLFAMVHTALPGDKHKCSRCGSSHVDIYEYEKKKVQACLDCGKEEKFLAK